MTTTRKTLKITALAAILIAASAAAAQAEPHAITEWDVTIVHDCHALYLDGHVGSSVEKADHSTAYDCYKRDQRVYETLVDMAVQGTSSEQDDKLRRLVFQDKAYFELSLDSDEK